MSDISIQRVEGLGMITLKGDLDMLAKASGLKTPGLRRIERSDTSALLWMAPDELLLTCLDAPARVLALGTALDGAFATCADVSDARAVFDIEGQGAEAILAKLMPVDFATLAADEVRRTRLAQVAAALWREGAAWRVVCFRSVADYVEDALCNAADGPIPPIRA